MLPVGIRIYCGDDRWRIRWKSTEGASVLEHNNYVRTLAGERYFGKGYHEQHIRPNTVTSALHYLMAYDYQAYHGEAAKERGNTRICLRACRETDGHYSRICYKL